MNVSPFSGVVNEISDFQSSTYATVKRLGDIEREEQKPGKNMIDLQHDDEWMSIVFQSSSPVLLNFYKSGHDLSKLLYPRLMDMFIGSQAAWELVGAEVSRVPKLVAFMEVDQVPSLYLIHEGNVIESLPGVPNDFQLSQLLGRIEDIATKGTSVL